MKRCLLLILFPWFASPLFAQYVYTINADSVKITNHCDTAELILENHTQTVPGFLFNKGRGRTEFRRGLFTIDDTLYLIGADTLNLAKGTIGLMADNGVLRTGNTFEFGNDESDPYYGPAYQNRNTYYHQNSAIFNWMTGYSGIFTFSKTLYGTTETDALSPYNIVRFAVHGPEYPTSQGGILMESKLVNAAGPLSWIAYKNISPYAANFRFYGDSLSGLFGTFSNTGTDGKAYSFFEFQMANDTASSNGQGDNYGLRVYPSFTTTWGVTKTPTVLAKRFVVSQDAWGNGHLPDISYSNPYSRLIVDARNYPLVVTSLPSKSDGYALIIDDDGKVWKGNATSASLANQSLSCNDATIRSSLAVNGDITAKKLTLFQTGWPDYVFDSAYHRPSLAALEQYIKQYNHLPEMPATGEVEKKGIDIGDNQAALLKKIEELTLYLIDQEKKWQIQNMELKKQSTEIENLKREMAELRNTKHTLL